MKYTITHTAEWVLLGILALLCIFTAYKAYQLKENVEYITTTDTIFVTDTITNWQPQYIKEYRTDTAYLPVIDTLLDTVTDTVLVEIPVSLYHYDTTITDTTHTTRIQADVSGFNVSLEQLTATTEIMPQTVKKQPLWHNLCPSIGIGYGTAGWGAFVGVGYKLF